MTDLFYSPTSRLSRCILKRLRRYGYGEMWQLQKSGDIEKERADSSVPLAKGGTTSLP